MITLILTALGIAGATVGSVVKGNQLSKQRKALDKKIGELDSWYNQHRSENIIDTSQVQSMVTEQMKQEKKRNDSLTNTVSKGSITPEKQVALASSNNINWADQISKVAQQDYAYKQQIEDTYNTSYNNLQNNLSSVHQGQTNNVSGSMRNAIDILHLINKS